MSIEERKKEKLEAKSVLIVIVGLILLGLYYFDYDFNDNLYNGLIILVLSIFIFTILSTNKYYIETGKYPATDDVEFKLFNQMHPFLQLYDKLLIIIFFVMVVVSIIMIISSFF